MKHIIHIILTLVIYSLASGNVCAQQKIMQCQTVTTSGGSQNMNFHETSVLIQQSIGQASNTGTFSNSKTIVHQGFIQPKNFGFDEKVGILNLRLSYFPNPFIEELNIEFEELLPGDIKLQLVDLSGRIIKNSIYEGAQNLTVNYADIDPGFYLLIIQIDSIGTTIKINKQ